MSIATKTVRPSYIPKFMPPSDCVLWLPGQDDPQSSTIRDRSGNGNNGTITQAVWTRLPKGLWCLYFDGSDDYVNCGAGASLNITAAVTMELWFYATAFTATYPSLILKRLGDSRQYQIYLNTGDKLAFECDNGASTDTGAALVIEKWYHVAATYSDADDEVKFYVNGTLSSTIAATYALPSHATAPLLIGRESTTGTNPWHGYQILNRVYSSTLTLEKLKGHYDTERHLFGV